MSELSKEERAYRRGAVEAVKYLRHLFAKVSDRDHRIEMHWRFENALAKARDNTDPRYLGTYLDEIMKDVCGDRFGGIIAERAKARPHDNENENCPLNDPETFLHPAYRGMECNCDKDQP